MLSDVAHTLFLHYARAIALGIEPASLSAAKEEQAAFLALYRTIKHGDRKHHNVDLVQMAAIAERVLEGELRYRGGEYGEAFKALEEAICLFDVLPYDEPHGWLISVRQTLGALLTEQRQYTRAITLYDEDLTLFPRNPWSLAGLKRCLEATGQPRAKEVGLQLAMAMKHVDVQISVSCACARAEGKNRRSAGSWRPWVGVPLCMAVVAAAVAVVLMRHRS
uniref:ER membrane protein complex subunit 2 n=1 Tax=Haptolina brevifila TaxID=156173 RepID=A0A7S2MLL9_9EUKA|mmetsp:Transcript_54577/g.108351  ORF Transcript_54577/g.108351 Transcript_54577/m.108351 type:complete len:221 (+) Transcript_54577:104-766(+)